MIKTKKTKKAPIPKPKPQKESKDKTPRPSILIFNKPILEILELLGVELDATAKRVVKILEENERVSENELAEELSIKINTTRKALYALNALRFAFYTKEKDEEKKWWYIYYWTLDINKIKEAYLNHKKKELLEKEDDLLAEQDYSFRCKSCKKKCKYEAALNANFKCPECNCSLAEVKSNRDINKLKEEILEVRKEIGLDQEE